MEVNGLNRGTATTHVQAVLAIDDRVLRNYWVTQTYSDLAAGLSRLLGPNTANWCTFGTWASDTVGRNIRGEDLPKWLHDRVVLHDGMMGAIRSVNEGPQGKLLSECLHLVTPDHVIDVVRELLGACAVNLSNGNTEVFAEIAPAAATFIACFGAQPSHVASARRGSSSCAMVHHRSKASIACVPGSRSGAMPWRRRPRRPGASAFWPARCSSARTSSITSRARSPAAWIWGSTKAPPSTDSA